MKIKLNKDETVIEYKKAFFPLNPFAFPINFTDWHKIIVSNCILIVFYRP